jgi:hypothetical protein
MKILRRLEQQTPEEFAALGKGSFSFLCRFPDGRDYTVTITAGLRGKVRHAELDVFSTDWALKSSVSRHGHSFSLTVTCPSEEFGSRMQKAVSLLPTLLTPLSSAPVLAGQAPGRS